MRTRGWVIAATLALALATGGPASAQQGPYPVPLSVEPLLRGCDDEQISDALGMQTGTAACPDGQEKVIVLAQGVAYREVHPADGDGYTLLYRWVVNDWREITDSRNP
jgi:hypothetical protein